MKERFFGRGILKPRCGNIGFPNDVSFGHLPQQMIFDDGKNVYDEALMAFSEVLNMQDELEKIRQKKQFR